MNKLKETFYDYENAKKEYVFLYPISFVDMEYIRDLDSAFYLDLQVLNNLLLDYVCQDITHLNYLISTEQVEITSSFLVDAVLLYRVDSLSYSEDTTCSESVTKYHDSLVENLDISDQELDLYIKVLPFEEYDFSQYFVNMYDTNREEFLKQSQRIVFFMLSNEIKLYNQYKIFNLLNGGDL